MTVENRFDTGMIRIVLELRSGSSRTISVRTTPAFTAMAVLMLPLLLTWQACLTTGFAAERPNVLFIAIDDLRPEVGAYGATWSQTPHLDQLATQSVSFARHYVQVPTCGASRFALLTGRSPWNSGVTRQNNALYSGKNALTLDSTRGAQSMPELFRTNGYHTICIGKISHTPDGKVFAYNGDGDGRVELPNAWDELATPYGPWERGWGTFFAYAEGKHREDGQGHSELFEFEVEQDDALPDGLMASAAIEKLAELAKQDQPFFLGLGFFKPHLPFVATEADWRAFDETAIPLAESADRLDSAYWHGSGEFYRYKTTWQKSKPLDKDAQATAKRAYLACVRYTDRQVGRVLEALEELGLDDNTIIVVWGDHGWHLGEHAIWGKHSPFEVALRSVLMIRAPHISQAGHVSNALVESTDLYPTLVDLCDLPDDTTAHPLDGKSLRSLLVNPNSMIRSTAISYWGKAISIRTDQFRLIATRDVDDDLQQWSQIELYDQTQSDSPRENLAEQQPGLVEEILRMANQRLHPDAR